MVWNDAIWEWRSMLAPGAARGRPRCRRVVLAELMERLHSGLLGLVTELFHLASKTAPMLTILS
jgi:hypothetical protein